jgi:uncharacterized membrane protein YfcA
MEGQIFVLLAGIFLMAALYSLVGHGGASGYIAIMALLGFAPVIIRPTALVLNIVVSLVAAMAFMRARHFSWRLFWPFAAMAVPCSYLGGSILLPPHLYRPLIGVLLCLAALSLLRKKEEDEALNPASRPPLALALFLGGLLGLLSGLSGVGGGIFLSPLLLLLNWGKAREVAGVSALFILCNSLSGLAGHLSATSQLPGYIPLIVGMALFGGILGSFYGSSRLRTPIVIKALSLVLVIAGMKIMLS